MDSPITADDDASTPLTAEELQALIPAHVTLRSELNELEQEGVIAADTWAFSRRRANLLDEHFIGRLHKRMFGSVWKWAGQYRTSARSLGVDHWQIRPQIRTLLGDAEAWLEQTSYPRDEIAVRFHHRLVFIHPFPNGNGRLSRLMADLLVVSHGGERFTWGRGDLVVAGEARTRYIEALHAADGDDIRPLLAFARS